jgi:hypothetical protein
MLVFTFEFNNIPQLNSPINQIDDWSMFYFKSNKAMTNDDLPTYFIVNE